jgi:hypothetical protein
VPILKEDGVSFEDDGIGLSFQTPALPGRDHTRSDDHRHRSKIDENLTMHVNILLSSRRPTHLADILPENALVRRHPGR